ncbi:sulfotransferase [Caballeronia novacaledonica]|uniref:sulfotransferase n=1 Tax=Caballeronia novacaledonica TaxID=1544861 RepID=UPI001EE1B140|nr:sulfotransferase [Caballeronia novacaledonica]GJH09273.1 sulfotransferase [Caballeronia novacaledonica]
MLKYPYGLTFCVGAPRSGTTLFGSLLTEGETAFPMLPECTYITQLIRLYHDILNYSDPQRFKAFAKSKEDLSGVFSASIDKFIRLAHSHFGHLKGSQLVLKDPELTIFLDQLPDFFESFKIICVVRDPINVVASMRTVFSKQGRDIGFEELLSMVFNYYWRASESQLSKSGAMHFVNFEKILDGDALEFEKTEIYLGYSIGRRGFGKIFFDFDSTDATHSSNYGQPIARPERSGNGLSEEERLRTQSAFSGYNLTYQWW